MKSRRDAVCALVSGGVESAAILHWLAQRGRPVFPLYITCGYRWETAEQYWLKRIMTQLSRHTTFLNPLTIMPVPLAAMSTPRWSLRGRVPGANSRDHAVYLPGRNLILLTGASLFCAAQRLPSIAIGTLRGNPFSDATQKFFRAMAHASGLALHTRMSILTPFRRLSKSDVLRATPEALLSFSWSCIAPVRGRHCGRCNKCAERQKGFRTASLPDPTHYAR